jgi:hypothetical protein
MRREAAASAAPPSFAPRGRIRGRDRGRGATQSGQAFHSARRLSRAKRLLIPPAPPDAGGRPDRGQQGASAAKTGLPLLAATAHGRT